jgi:DNA-binding beta-propeller fold protein YncE
MVDRTADTVVFGTAGTPGALDGELHCPALACFVHRNGADTLLISDLGNDRVVEITASGLFLRTIALKKDSGPWGIAYCGVEDVIAVSLRGDHAVVLLQHESGVVKPEVTIGSGGRGDEQLYSPCGVTFTADGRYILVADCGNHRVSKFNAVTGAFIAHVATEAANGIRYPSDALHCEDGSTVVVAQMSGRWGSVVCVGKNGVTVNSIFIGSGRDFIPRSLSYSPSLHGVVIKTFGGKLFLLRNAWIHSSRCAWLSALSFS